MKYVKNKNDCTRAGGGGGNDADRVDFHVPLKTSGDLREPTAVDERDAGLGSP